MGERKEIGLILDELWGKLWSAGVTEPLISIEQIAFFMLLKRLDLAEKAEGNAQLLESHERLRWDSLRKVEGGELITILKQELEPLLERVGGSAFVGAQLAISDPDVVRSCLGDVDRLGFEHEPAAHQGEVFSQLLARLKTSGQGGELQTPKPVARLMAELADPRPGESVGDPAVGAGGLLVEAARHAGGGEAAPTANLHGYDVNPGMVRLAAYNLLFHGIEDLAVRQVNVLSPTFRPSRYDVILTAPPFGAVLPPNEVNPKLGNARGRQELLFLELCREMQLSTVAVLVPESVLFGKSGEFTSVRRKWLEELCVNAIVLLPPDALLPYTSVRTAIVLASRGPTDTVWFCPLESSRRKESADQGDLFAAAAEAVKAKLGDREPQGEEAKALARTMFQTDYDVIRTRNWSLSPALYRPAPEFEREGERPLDVMNELVAGEDEIARQLDEARSLLEQIE
ncbi:MAG: HsdM family class I SAM-dependent methyltransferase [Solirubrobacterales bacterium]